jgi:predicted RNA binding protein YcfA (HicA-like mRNA interferase family)
MPKLPIVNAKQVINALEKIDFQIIRQRGSHVQMKHQDGRFVTIPFHGNQNYW